MVSGQLILKNPEISFALSSANSSAEPPSLLIAIFGAVDSNTVGCQVTSLVLNMCLLDFCRVTPRWIFATAIVSQHVQCSAFIFCWTCYLGVLCRGHWITQRPKATWRAYRRKGDTWEMSGDVLHTQKLACSCEFPHKYKRMCSCRKLVVPTGIHFSRGYTRIWNIQINHH